MRVPKSSIGLAASMEANFGFFLGPYSIVFRSNVRISFSPLSFFVFLKNPCPVLSPNHLFSTIFSSQVGMANWCLASSSGQFSNTPFATRTSVSMPTTSAVRKVADLGRPIIGPVNASSSSMPKPIFSMVPKSDMIPKMPMRFAINAGVSLHKTVVLPKYRSPYCIRKSTTHFSVWAVGIISNNLRYRGGLKRCAPQKCFLKSSDLPSAIMLMGIPEVLEVMRVPGFLYFSTFSKSCCLISSRSTTTSTIQSQSAILERSSSKFPVVIFFTTSFV